MRLSTERILTTHVGSLPRSDEVVALLYKRDGDEPYDRAAYDTAVAAGVADAVAKVAAGVDAIAAAMRPEYDAIAAAGFLLQLDCPDIAMARHTGFQELDEAEFLRRAEYQVEALNHAVREGCIASTSNYVEHPRLIAEQLCQFAGLVGRERVIAGADCGFGSFAGYSRVDPAIAYKKLRALAEGAALATDKLW